MIERDAIVAVTDADRQCASDIIALIAGGDDQSWALVHSIKRGQSDSTNIVQRVARHRATHAGEVERLREATDILQRLHDHDGWGGKGYNARKAFDAKEDGKAFLARQALEASR